MQTWEYMYIIKFRQWREIKDKPYYSFNNWSDTVYFPDGTCKKNDGDFALLLNSLGENGWELVAVSPRSGHLGGTSYPKGTAGVLVGLPPVSLAVDYAGFTDTEVWVFKRPKP